MDYSNQNTPLIKLKKICRIYSREVLEISIRAILLLIGTVVLSLMVLYFYGSMNQKKVTQKIAHNIKLLDLGPLD